MSKYSGYDVRDRSKCYKRECFVPFSGNGRKTCRLYELGQCPEKYRTTKKEMTSFAKFYLSEKSISTREPVETQEDKDCVLFGQKLANRFGLILNGWQEITFMFTIPDGLPDGRNTFTAKNEKELVNKLQEKFPAYFDYIMEKNFPNGYKPDPTFSEPPQECEPMDLAGFAASLKSQNKVQ